MLFDQTRCAKPYNQKQSEDSRRNRPCLAVQSFNLDRILVRLGQAPHHFRMQLQDVETFYPLSPLQQGLLFHSLTEPGSGMYFNQSVMTLRGQLDRDAFTAAWQRAVAEHPILRTFFVWEGVKQPIQVVRNHAEMPFDWLDWSELSSKERETKLFELRQSDLKRGFDLSKAPLMRAVMIRTGADSHDFLWSFHHILMDGWSMFHVLRQVFASYDANVEKTQVTFEPSRPYRDHIVWLSKQSREQAKEFWQRSLKGFTAPTPLFNDVSVDATAPRADEFGTETGYLSVATTEALGALSRKHGLTLNTIMQGSWALLLSRFSGEPDVCLGAVVSGRPADLPGVESMVGLFINSLPIRVTTPADEKLLPWLKRIQIEHAEVREYEYSPLVEVQSWSEVPGGTQLFDSLFLFENYRKDVELEDMSKQLAIEDVQWFERLNYPLTAIGIPGDEMALRVTYRTDSYTRETIERMLGQWRTLLDGMAADLDSRLADLPLLTKSETQQIVHEFNATSTDHDRGLCIHEMFEAQAARTPDAPALAWGGAQLSYSELDARANQLAHYLRDNGVTREVLVGVCLKRDLDIVPSLLAIMKAGGTYLPLDPEYPTDRLAYTLEDGNAAIVLTQSDVSEKLEGRCGDARIINLDAIRDDLSQQASTKPKSDVLSSNLAYVIYTSGSTGRPKGTAIEHRSLTTLIQWARTVYSDDELRGVLLSTSICFDLSTFEMFVPLSWGGQVILADNALELASIPLRDKVTLINTVPSAIAALIDMQAVPKSVITVNLAGEPLRTTLVDLVYELGIQKVYDLYGPSEDTTYTTFTLREKGGRYTIGRPVANTEIYLLDAEQKPVPIGVSGELYAGGDGLARGYLNRPELTAERWLPDPFSGRPGARLYRTGDVARYLPDGNLELLGRMDHQVKIRGFRIELGEIEIRLGQHEDIDDVVAVAREDTPGDKRIVAYIVHKSGSSPSLNDLRNFIRETLPEYMVPAVFMVLEALPRTPNGKVDRKVLPEPEETHTAADSNFAAPSNEIETKIAEIWQRILSIQAVGTRDNFFDLGGHSLLMIRLHGELKRAFERQIPMVDLFRFPTVSSLAGYYSQADDTAATASVDNSEKQKAGKSRLAQMQKRRRKK
ncbi:MAG: amino acid adenylation domain-containing protein [Planctomycetota bacterium]